MDIESFLRESDRLAKEQAHAGGSRSASLPGEDPRSKLREDAQHWVAVYGELSRFKRSVLETMSAEGVAKDPAVRVELDRDRLELEIELERLDLHLRFWSERLAAASAG